MAPDRPDASSDLEALGLSASRVLNFGEAYTPKDGGDNADTYIEVSPTTEHDEETLMNHENKLEKSNENGQSDDDLTSLAWLHQQNLLKGLEISNPAKTIKDENVLNNNVCEDSLDMSENTNSVSSFEESYSPESVGKTSSSGSSQVQSFQSLSKSPLKDMQTFSDSSKSQYNKAQSNQAKISMINNNFPFPNRNKHPAQLPYDPHLHRTNKPPYSFSCLIFMAIEDSPIKALPVKEVYAWILQHFPYFRNAPTGWKNSVRHNLSLNKCFRKVEKAPNLGKGSLWMVDAQYRPNLIQALSRAPCPPPTAPNISPDKNPRKYINTRLPDPVLFPYLSKRLASSNICENSEMEFDSDVDAAAAAMLSFKHGPIILNHNKDRKKKMAHTKMVPVITRSSSEDHTYSCITSVRLERPSDADDYNRESRKEHGQKRRKNSHQELREELLEDTGQTEVNRWRLGEEQLEDCSQILEQEYKNSETNFQKRRKVCYQKLLQGLIEESGLMEDQAEENAQEDQVEIRNPEDIEDRTKGDSYDLQEEPIVDNKPVVEQDSTEENVQFEQDLVEVSGPNFRQDENEGLEEESMEKISEVLQKDQEDSSSPIHEDDLAEESDLDEHETVATSPELQEPLQESSQDLEEEQIDAHSQELQQGDNDEDDPVLEEQQPEQCNLEADEPEASCVENEDEAIKESSPQKSNEESEEPSQVPEQEEDKDGSKLMLEQEQSGQTDQQNEIKVCCPEIEEEPIKDSGHETTDEPLEEDMEVDDEEKTEESSLVLEEQTEQSNLSGPDDEEVSCSENEQETEKDSSLELVEEQLKENNLVHSEECAEQIAEPRQDQEEVSYPESEQDLTIGSNPALEEEKLTDDVPVQEQTEQNSQFEDQKEISCKESEQDVTKESNQSDVIQPEQVEGSLGECEKVSHELEQELENESNQGNQDEQTESKSPQLTQELTEDNLKLIEEQEERRVQESSSPEHEIEPVTAKITVFEHEPVEEKSEETLQGQTEKCNKNFETKQTNKDLCKEQVEECNLKLPEDCSITSKQIPEDDCKNDKDNENNSQNLIKECAIKQSDVIKELKKEDTNEHNQEFEKMNVNLPVKKSIQIDQEHEEDIEEDIQSNKRSYFLRRCNKIALNAETDIIRKTEFKPVEKPQLIPVKSEQVSMINSTNHYKGDVFEYEFIGYLMKIISMSFYGITAREIRSLAYDFAKHSGSAKFFKCTDNMAKRDWFYRFRLKYPNIIQDNPRFLPSKPIERHVTYSRLTVQKFFETLKTIMEIHSISSLRIYNVHECHLPAKMNINDLDETNDGLLSEDKNEHITVICCIGSNGMCVSPITVFPKIFSKHTCEESTNSFIKMENSLEMFEETGYITGEIFLKWLKHFVKIVPVSTQNKLLLILNGHISHKYIEAINFAEKNGIILMFIPQFCEQQLMPLNVIFFEQMKRAYNDLCTSWLQYYPFIGLYDIRDFVSKAYNKVASKDNAKYAFLITGIHPCNPNILLQDIEIKKRGYLDTSKLKRMEEMNVYEDEIEEIEEIEEVPETEDTKAISEDEDIEDMENEEIEEALSNRNFEEDQLIERIKNIIKKDTSSEEVLEIHIIKEDKVGCKTAKKMKPKLIPRFPKNSKKNEKLARINNIRIQSSQQNKSKGSNEMPSISFVTNGSDIEKLYWSQDSNFQNNTEFGLNSEGEFDSYSPEHSSNLKRKRPFFELESFAEHQAKRRQTKQKKPIKTKLKKEEQNSEIEMDIVQSQEQYMKYFALHKDDEDTSCMYCSEKFLLSRRKEIWLQCMQCQRWAHCKCAGLKPTSKLFICESCSIDGQVIGETLKKSERRRKNEKILFN